MNISRLNAAISLISLLLLFNVNIFAGPMSGASWMVDMSKDLAEKPLNQVILPGSHDSATYKLESTFAKGQELSAKLNKLKKIAVGYALTSIAKSWGTAQDRTIYQQLNDGIRYLDLRVTYRDDKKQFYMVHGLFGPPLANVLSQITRFMREHPREILVIQVGDLNYMGESASNIADNHRKLAQIFLNAFGTKMVKKSEVVGPEVTVGELWKKQKQIFMIYKSAEMSKTVDEFWWRDTTISDYWANTDEVSTLKSRIDANMNTRTNDSNGSKFFVTQSQMTGNGNTISKSLIPGTSRYRSLKDMAQDVFKELPGWLKSWKNRNPNIIILDFANAQTSQQIYLLNK
jgi:hypothetical protein